MSRIKKNKSAWFEQVFFSDIWQVTYLAGYNGKKHVSEINYDINIFKLLISLD